MGGDLRGEPRVDGRLHCIPRHVAGCLEHGNPAWRQDADELPNVARAVVGRDVLQHYVAVDEIEAGTLENPQIIT
jgi:hypothetical protein